ncbi:MAG: quinone-dependent dihydroorotate dehydrogenase [Bacteroidota bacterium]
MYTQLLRPLLFQIDPEKVHHLSMSLLQLTVQTPVLRDALFAGLALRDLRLEREVFGLKFINPVGLAAGFDKDALLAHRWKYLGFGFVEVGTVTPRPQGGNPKPRLFRLPQDSAVINRMGFNNQGVEAMARRLEGVDRGKVVLGANIGKNKDTPNEEAVNDYLICFERLFDLVDYFVVNVSSPNTPGLRSLQEKEPLTRLLLTLQEQNQSKPQPKPLLLKIAPDLHRDQLDDILIVARESQLSGLIATNTTISRDQLASSARAVDQAGAGGLSGKPLTASAQEVLGYLAQELQGEIPLIGVGGIMQGQDAVDRLRAGASLIQIYTGFVYQGPGFVRQLLQAILNHSKD